MKRSRGPSGGAGPRCRAHVLEISQYLDGELPARRRAALERHIETCACCSTLAHRLRTVAAITKGERTAAPKRVQALAAKRVRNLLDACHVPRRTRRT